MSALIQKLSGALKMASPDWNWALSYAPTPGQQRIKITGRKLGTLEVAQTLILTEELCKSLSPIDLAHHVINLIECPLMKKQITKRESETISQPDAGELSSIESEYQILRRSYRTSLDEMNGAQRHSKCRVAWLGFLGVTRSHPQPSRR